jgi:hypothetical protein
MRIIEVTDLHWPFEAQPYVLRGRTRMTVDPFPCYAHDTKLVRKLLKDVEARSIRVKDGTLYISHFEEESRTNGYAAQSYDEWDEVTGKWVPAQIIVLQGKRIPIHPAMTRYLVPHEFGHIVENKIQAALGIEEHNREPLLSGYAKLRKLEYSDGYGARRWHLNTGEVFANDFRCLLGYETDFWPHAGIKQELNKPTKDWWDHILSSKPTEWVLCGS